MPSWNLQPREGTRLLFIFHILIVSSLHLAWDESSLGTRERGQRDKLTLTLSL